MKTFISPTASPLLKQVVETIEQQEVILSTAEKKAFPFWKRVVDTASQVYHANKIKVHGLSFFGTASAGYSLTVNNETCSFLLEREEVGNV